MEELTQEVAENDSFEQLKQLHDIGFQLVGLYADSNSPTYKWKEGNPPIFNNPSFWNPEKLEAYFRDGLFINIATVIGRTHLKSGSQDLYLNAIDTDSVEVGRRLSIPLSELFQHYPHVQEMVQRFVESKSNPDYNTISLLDVLKQVTYVTKTRKGYHVYWLSTFIYENIKKAQCKPSNEFELFTAASPHLCHLPTSVHRNDASFRYQAVGRQDKILQSAELYGIFDELFKDLLVDKRLDDDYSTTTEPGEHEQKLNQENPQYGFNLRVLTLKLSKELLLPYYIQNYRQDFALAFAGTAFHAKISEESATSILEEICSLTKDDEIRLRLDALHSTYEKGLADEVITGAPTLAELVAQAGRLNIKKAERIVQDLKNIWKTDTIKEFKIDNAVNALLDKYRFLSIMESNDILYYNEGSGVYQTRGDKIIDKELEEIYDTKINIKQVAEVKAHIQRRTWVSRNVFDADINIINLKNGLYNIQTGQLIPHTADYYSINQKSITFNPDAESKLFLPFLEQVLYKEDIQTAIDIMAYTFLRENPHELLTILLGTGSNGKSVFVHVLTKLHGNNNVSNVSLGSLVGNRFAAADLEGKDVNVDPELSSATIKDTSMLKKLSGSHQIRIERKGRNAYDVNLHAKLIFLANSMPDTTDFSDAHMRRLVMIPFPNQFEGKDADIKLKDKLTTDEEMSGIFNILMDALRGILKDEQIHQNDKTIDDRRKKYEKLNNPVYAFLEECNDPETTNDATISKEDLHNSYKQFCITNKLPYQRKETFGKMLKNLGCPDKMQGKDRVRVWCGIKLIKFANTDPQQGTLSTNQ